MAEHNASIAEAAKKFDVSRSSVYRWVGKSKTDQVRSSLKASTGNLKVSPSIQRKLSSATMRILDYLDSDAALQDGGQTAAFTRSLLNLVKVCPELVQLHTGEVEALKDGEEAERLALALGLDPLKPRGADNG